MPGGERLYAIGDVHGRLDLLEELIAAIRADNAARGTAHVTILLLGDIVDRGDDSAALIAQCMEFTRRSVDFIVLKGNHEAMMVEAYRGNRTAMRVWIGTGGAATLYSWGVAPELIDQGDPATLIAAMRARVPKVAIAWLDQLPITHRAGDYFFVHAGVRPGIALEKQRTEDMLWIKEEFTEDATDHPMMIVHGHSEQESGPAFLANRIGIDTGAYRTDRLTALGIEGRETWTLQALGPHG